MRDYLAKDNTKLYLLISVLYYSRKYVKFLPTPFVILYDIYKYCLKS